MYVFMCACVWLRAENSALYASETDKDNNTKFCAQFEINVKIIITCFCENQKTESGVGLSQK